MRSVCYYIFLTNFGFTYSRLRDVGEVTNYTLYINTKLNSNNTIYDKLLMGGNPTNPEDLPHNILFLNYHAVCAGVILSNAIVLTCAHCFDTNKNIPDMKVFAGARHNFDKKADAYDVWDFIIHKDYDHPIRFANDIALLLIRGQFEFKSTVQKAMLIDNRDWVLQEGTVFQVSGWEEQVHKKSETTVKLLVTANMRYVSHRLCIDKIQSPLSPDMFCLDGDKGKGICRGDSGGAAMLNNYVVGIASHIVRCGELPGIYINLYYLRPWINLHSQKLYHKYCSFYNGNINSDY